MNESYFNLRDLSLSTDFFITRIRARVLTSDDRLEPLEAILLGKYRERFRSAAAVAFEGYEHFIVDELIEERVSFEGDALEALANEKGTIREVSRVETWRKNFRK